MRSSYPRKLVGLGSALVTAAMVLSSAGVVSAAIPDATAVSGPIPEFYTAGHAAGFRGTFTLNDNNLSKLFLHVTSVNSSAIAYYHVTKNGNDVTDKCTLEDVTFPGDVVCTLKTIRKNDHFVAVVGYTPAAGVTTVTANFAWSSVGIPDNGDMSHGDKWDNVDRTASLKSGDDAIDYAGGLTTTTDTSIANAGIGGSNIQATKLVGLPVGVAATVKDGILSNPCTVTDYTNCVSFIGEWSDVTVGDGENFPQFQIQITFASSTPKSFVHTFTNAAGQPDQEPINACKKNISAPCFTWDSKTKTATIYTLHNGSYRGQ